MPRSKHRLTDRARAEQLTDLSRLSPPDVIPTLTAREITDAIRRDSDRHARRTRAHAQRERCLNNADRGQDTINHYASLPGMDDDAQTVLTDLLADLMHAAAENPNLVFQTALDSAETHYTAERNGED